MGNTATKKQFSYKLTFDKVHKFTLEADNLDEVHARVVRYIEKNNLKECKILCPNGITRRAWKSGEWHWKHNGYSFD